jgi:hypothetical protein
MSIVTNNQGCEIKSLSSTWVSKLINSGVNNKWVKIGSITYIFKNSVIQYRPSKTNYYFYLQLVSIYLLIAFM